MKKQPQIIKYEGNNEELFEKLSLDDCVYGSKIIVPETHSAIFLKDGILMNVLEPGAHEIFEMQKTGLFCKKPTSCVVDVVYMSKHAKLQVFWGTKKQFDTRDPITDLPIKIGCSGEFEVQIGNPKKAYLELIGATKSYTLSEMKERLQGRMSVYIEEAIARAMREKSLSYDRFSEYKNEIAKNIEKIIAKMFEQNYGLKLFSFTLATVVIPDEYIRDIKDHLKKIEDEKKVALEKEERRKREEEERIRAELAEEKRKTEEERIEDKRRADEERKEDRDWEREKWLLELKSKDYEKYLEVLKALGEESRSERKKKEDKDWEHEKWLMELKIKDYEKYIEIVKSLVGSKNN